MKTYEELLAERDALAAQLHLIKNIFRDDSLSPSETLRKMPFAIDMSAEQCLAEIRAQSIEDFCKSVDGLAMNQTPTDNDCSEDMVIGWKAGNVDCRMAGMKYAAKVRQGGNQ